MTLSDQVAELEREAQRLSRLVDAMGEELETLKQREQAKDRLIDLVETDILWQEQNLARMAGNKSERMKEIVAAYRAVRPKEGE
jgi:predicted  nucleic acid-binding Zn-ribbon protein